MIIETKAAAAPTATAADDDDDEIHYFHPKYRTPWAYKHACACVYLHVYECPAWQSFTSIHLLKLKINTELEMCGNKEADSFQWTCHFE